MERLVAIERACLMGHLVAMGFGLAGLLLVMPHPEFLAMLPQGKPCLAGAWQVGGWFTSC